MNLPRDRVAGFLVERRTDIRKHAGPGPEVPLYRGERGAMRWRGHVGRATISERSEGKTLVVRARPFRTAVREVGRQW